jgi:hypothetical protein
MFKFMTPIKIPGPLHPNLPGLGTAALNSGNLNTQAPTSSTEMKRSTICVPVLPSGQCVPHSSNVHELPITSAN